MGRHLQSALYETAARLKGGAAYRWTHQGMCNCGHLAQTVTNKSAAEIHRVALEKAGEWADHAVDYCADSQFPIDHIIEALTTIGLSPEDIVHLEHLSDPRVVRATGRAYLDKKSRDDVVLYLETWASQADK